MTDKLPPNLLALFAPRPKLPYLAPPDQAPAHRRTAHISPLAGFLPQLAEYKATDQYNATESHEQRKERIKREKTEHADLLSTKGAQLFDAKTDPNIKGDPLKTLFVARLSYDITEKELEQEFGRYGPITNIRIVANEKLPKDAPKQKRLKGYAFIEYERAKDMTAAYKETENLRLKGRSVVVDVERGRTVANWRPMRLGGGLGGRHFSKPGARPAASSSSYGPPSGPGGFRGGLGGSRPGGGFRGDFRGGRGGGFRGSSGGYGGRGGIGYQSNGFAGAVPDGAPQGPRGGYGGSGGRSNGGGFSGGRYDDRYGGGSGSGSNREPVGPRGSGGYRDYDRDGGQGRDDPRKRRYDGDSYDDRQRTKAPRY